MFHLSCFNGGKSALGIPLTPEEVIVERRILLTKSLIITMFLISFLLLGGCVQTTPYQKYNQEMMANGTKFLTDDEIKSVFTGNTEIGENKKKNYNYADFFAPDGTLKSRTWGKGFEESEPGKWSINDQSMLCMEFEGRWAGSGEQCFYIYRGNSENAYISALSIGKPTKSTPSGIYEFEVVSGNQSGVK